MLHVLRNLRDFLTPDRLQHLVGNLQSGTFMLLRTDNMSEAKFSLCKKCAESKPPHMYCAKCIKGMNSMETYKVSLQVFTKNGTWIGEISNPDFIPNTKE